MPAGNQSIRGVAPGNNMKREFAIMLLLASATPAAAQWLTLPTPNVPRLEDGTLDQSAPVPRAATGRPDLSGLWRPSRVQGDLNERSKFQAWVSALIDEREARYFADDPRFSCLPSGPSNITIASNSYGLRRILQHPSMIAMLYNDMTYRQIFMDGRELERDPLPTWMGYSVGRWDGDTLVVESNGYNGKTWLNRGLSHTDQLRITERYRRVDFGHIEVNVTYEDPGAFESELHAVIDMEFVADDEMLETVCNEAYSGERSGWTSEVSQVGEAAVALSPDEFANYVGTYKGVYLGNAVTVEVTIEDGELYMQRNNAPRAPLIPQSETAFIHSGLGFVFSFGDDGVATEVSEVHVSGAWTFSREP